MLAGVRGLTIGMDCLALTQEVDGLNRNIFKLEGDIHRIRELTEGRLITVVSRKAFICEPTRGSLRTGIKYVKAIAKCATCQINIRPN